MLALRTSSRGGAGGLLGPELGLSLSSLFFGDATVYGAFKALGLGSASSPIVSGCIILTENISIQCDGIDLGKPPETAERVQ